LLANLATAYRELTNAFVETQSLDAELLPAAEQTLAETQAGYKRGRFTLLSVLDSRSALFEISEARLNALRRYSRSLATIESLTAPAQLSR
jgi:outer membrane protein TolC